MNHPPRLSFVRAAWALYVMLRELESLTHQNQHLEHNILSHCQRYQLRCCDHCRRPDWGTIRKLRRYCGNCVAARRVRPEGRPLWF